LHLIRRLLARGSDMLKKPPAPEALMPATAPGPGARRWQRLWVTRPAAEAAHWVQALRAAGWQAEALPLIDITEPADPVAQAALAQHRRRWWQADALMFVSAAAVQHFFAHGVAPAPAAHRFTTRFWAPGPGTARALARALAALGVGADRIDAPPPDAAQFDSEHLWPVVASQLHRGARVLIVRGHSPELDGPREAALPGTGRDWLIRRCEAAGAAVEACVAYERRAPVWSERERVWVCGANDADQLWLLSSSEALTNLQSLVPGIDWSAAGALATHPRIAAAARSAGFGQVIESRPALPDVVRALESVRSCP
jgi:uroporphyrinogen-III synthase